MGAFLKGSSDPRMEEAASRFSATSSHDAKSLRPAPAERKRAAGSLRLPVKPGTAVREVIEAFLCRSL